MAVAFRNAQTGTSGAGDVTVTKPTGTAEGDLLLFVGVAEDGFVTGATIDALPDGFVEDANSYHDAGANYARLYLARKIAGGSEPADYTFGTSVGDNIIGALLAYSGVDGTTPFDVTTVEHVGSASTTQTSPSISPTSTGCMLINVLSAQTDAFTTTANGAMNERVDTSSTAYVSLFVADELLSASGATGTRAHTISGSFAALGYSIVLRPSGGASIVPQAMASYRQQ